MKKGELLIFIITYKAKERVYNVFKKINFNTLKKYKVHLLISDGIPSSTNLQSIRSRFESVKGAKNGTTNL